MTDETLLQTRSLTKEFRGFRAVSEVDLVVQTGTVHALVGPNGAGKTTLFNLLTGFLTRPPARSSTTARTSPASGPRTSPTWASPARSRSPASSTRSPSGEHLELALASRTGLGMRFWQSVTRFGRFEDRTTALLDQVGLADLSGLPAGSLAYGQKRALELALALALDPKLLLLDEPTAGMGVEDVDRTIALVKQVAEGRTVVLVDHNMHVVGSPGPHRHRPAVRPGPGRGSLRAGAAGRESGRGLPRHDSRRVP